jgi:hypothetical protein
MGNQVVDSAGGMKVRKAEQVVMARESGEIDLIDRKLFNYLLKRGYRTLQERTIHEVPVRDVLEYLRFTSTTPLNESLSRLGKANIEIDYRDADGSDHTSVLHYLSFDLSKTENGILQFAFDPILLKFLYQPKIYATLDLNTYRKFKSNYAAKLYEVMSMIARRRDNVWSPTVQDMCDRLGVPVTMRDRFDNLRARVIEKAVDEVNDLAEFDLTVDYIRGGRGGKVIRVSFQTQNKSHIRLLQSRDINDPRGRQRGAPRDPKTVDIMDGRTDEERNGPVLNASTLGHAKSIVGKEDVSAYEEAWWKEMNGRSVKDPDISFIRWLEAQVAKEADSSVAEVEDDTLASLIEKWESGR